MPHHGVVLISECVLVGAVTGVIGDLVPRDKPVFSSSAASTKHSLSTSGRRPVSSSGALMPKGERSGA